MPSDAAGVFAAGRVIPLDHDVDRTPQAYLRHWRMTLAHQDVDRGGRVQTVARRYGYTSPEALTRAFQRQYGINPSDLKREARAGG